MLELAVDHGSLIAHSVGGAFRFECELGGVAYGEAIVLDGAGRRASVRSEWGAGTIRHTADADFIASATGQVVVDPLIETIFALGFRPAVLDWADVAFNGRHLNYCVVAEEGFWAGDSDIVAWLVDAYTWEVSEFGYVDGTSRAWYQPSIGACREWGLYLVAATRRNNNGRRDVVARRRSGNTSFMYPTFVVDGHTASYDCDQASVCGDGRPSAPFIPAFRIASTRDYGTDRDVVIRTLNRQYVLGPVQHVAASPSFDESEPAFATATGLEPMIGSWGLTWRERDLTTGQESIHVQRYHLAAGVVVPDFVAYVAPSGATLGRPDISEPLGVRAPNGEPYYVVATTLTDAAGSRIQAILCAEGQTRSVTNLRLKLHEDDTQSQWFPRLAGLDDGFAMAYMESDPAPGSPRTGYVSTFEVHDDVLAVSERRMLLAGHGIQAMTGVASMRSGGQGQRGDYLVGYAVSTPPAYRVSARVFEPHAQRAIGVQYCYGNPNSTGERGFLAAYGTRDTTSAKLLHASDLPASSLGFFLASQSVGVGAPPGTSGIVCVGGSIGRYSNMAALSSTSGDLSLWIDPAQLVQPSGPVPALAGSQWAFQCWHRDSAGGSATSNFTNAVRITFE